MQLDDEADLPEPDQFTENGKQMRKNFKSADAAEEHITTGFVPLQTFPELIESALICYCASDHYRPGRNPWLCCI